VKDQKIPLEFGAAGKDIVPEIGAILLLRASDRAGRMTHVLSRPGEIGI
jgi:hypothetical protein